eukprot:gene10212-2369_t
MYGKLEEVVDIFVEVTVKNQNLNLVLEVELELESPQSVTQLNSSSDVNDVWGLHRGAAGGFC